MGIKLTMKWRSHGILWKSGHFYNFRYNAFRQDPNPTIILMYKVYGIHSNTGHQHRYIQAVNLNYIPRNQRKIFVKIWQQEMDKNKGNVEFTYQSVQFRFPYMEYAIRRYMLKPIYRIQKPKEIPPENLEDMVVSTWSQDFSKKLTMDLAQKKQRAMGRSDSLKKKYKKKWGMGRFFGMASRFFGK